MALTEIAGNFVEQVTGGRKAELDGDLAHKGKYSEYTSAGAVLTVNLAIDECYANVTSTSGGAITLNMPDVSLAKGRRYTINFTFATTNMTINWTGTSATASVTDGASTLVIVRSDGNNWIVETVTPAFA